MLIKYKVIFSATEYINVEDNFNDIRKCRSPYLCVSIVKYEIGDTREISTERLFAYDVTLFIGILDTKFSELSL